MLGFQLSVPCLLPSGAVSQSLSSRTLPYLKRTWQLFVDALGLRIVWCSCMIGFKLCTLDRHVPEVRGQAGSHVLSISPLTPDADLHGRLLLGFFNVEFLFFLLLCVLGRMLWDSVNIRLLPKLYRPGFSIRWCFLHESDVSVVAKWWFSNSHSAFRTILISFGKFSLSLWILTHL